MRYFNTEGRCKPDEHYMVGLGDRLDRIKKLFVDRGKYFVMNRGRQYGKTTTLMALAEYLKEDYIVLAMDFQLMSTANFADEQTFVAKFAGYMENLLLKQEQLANDLGSEVFQRLHALKGSENNSMDVLFCELSRMCETSKRPIVLIINEVDSASNHQVFIDFLAQLRGYYLNRENTPIFRSVILAGVYDIKNLKLKIHPDDQHQYNSPWNIAAKYYMEAQTRDARRTDLIVDYCGEQFIVELKIWHGNEYNGRGEQQLTEYPDYFQQKKGYLLSFNFN